MTILKYLKKYFSEKIDNKITVVYRFNSEDKEILHAVTDYVINKNIINLNEYDIVQFEFLAIKQELVLSLEKINTPPPPPPPPHNPPKNVSPPEKIQPNEDTSLNVNNNKNISSTSDIPTRASL